MYKKITLFLIYSALLFIAGFFAKQLLIDRIVDKPSLLNTLVPIDKPLEKYSIDSLAKSEIKPGKIFLKELITEEKEYTSYLFEFEFSPDLSSKVKTVTGQINIPKFPESSEPIESYPLVLMFRGYIDQNSYKTGDGTRNGAKFFAENGFVTIAPDFLGYGGSSEESGSIFETRFQTYTTALSLVKTLEQITKNPLLISGFPSSLDIKKIYDSKIFIWAHSNGGQIALTLLEASGVNYPTVLWAPVSKPFPYSILYYTDQSDDNGKLIRKELARFEEVYDVEKYSLSNYLDKINAPILLQQGTVDDAIPVVWSQELNTNLKSFKKNVRLIIYPGADHDMRPTWNEAIKEALDFYQTNNKEVDKR